ncbi:MAG: putative metal-dependent hydrolase [Francisellaceae bacterium]|nr:putative metal-dependent hydrolase [Francisellaceae bacterium]
MTRKIYLEDTYQFHSEGFILQVGEDEKGIFILLDQTVFYPQGGGQPSDQGVIKNDYFETNIILVRQINDEIRHYLTSPYNEISTGLKIECLVNQKRRMLNSRYHTAAHLLGNIVEKMYPKLKAIKGHSFPKESFVEFAETSTTTSLPKDNTLNLNEIEIAINDAIVNNYKTKIFEIDPISFQQQYYELPYRIPENKKFRVMQIGDMLPVPCGGTHLSSISTIGKFSINKIKVKNNIVRISYEVT